MRASTAIDDSTLDELLALATRLAMEAGELAQQMRSNVDLTGDTKSSATDIVTAADKAAEHLVLNGLERARPADAVLGEEGSDTAGTSGVRWLIDPIDGTTNYVYDIPAWSVSIAAEYVAPGSNAAPETLIGVVYDPVANDRFWAVRDRGAHRNEVSIHCNPKTEMATALVGTGFGYTPERRRGQAEVLLELLPQVRDIRRFGSAALDLCFVAEGRLDAYFERGLNPWDLAAGTLIAQEAGCSVGNLRGGSPSDVFTLAAHPPLFELLRAELVALDADNRA